MASILKSLVGHESLSVVAIVGLGLRLGRLERLLNHFSEQVHFVRVASTGGQTRLGRFVLVRRELLGHGRRGARQFELCSTRMLLVGGV